MVDIQLYIAVIARRSQVVAKLKSPDDPLRILGFLRSRHSRSTGVGHSVELCLSNDVVCALLDRCRAGGTGHGDARALTFVIVIALFRRNLSARVTRPKGSAKLRNEAMFNAAYPLSRRLRSASTSEEASQP